MNNVLRIFLLLLLLVQVLVITGCASSSSGNPSIVTPIEPGPPPDNLAPVIDSSDTVSIDLANTVDKVKGRNTFLPQRGVFFSVGIQNLERAAEPGNERTGSDSDITNVSIGYDQVVSDAWVVGTLLDMSRREDVSAVQEAFSTSSKSLSVFLFSSMVLKESFDLSAYAGFSGTDTSSTRMAVRDTVSVEDQSGNTIQQIQILPGEVRGNNNGNVISAGLSVARRIELSAGKQIFVRADADLFRISTDEFTEQGSTNSELAYRENTRQNMKWTLSGGISRPYSRSVGVLVPTITLALIHEKPDDDSIAADVVAVPDESLIVDSAPIDRSYGKVDFDLVLVRPGGLQFFGNLNSRFENEIEKSIGVTVGARLEF